GPMAILSPPKRTNFLRFNRPLRSPLASAIGGGVWESNPPIPAQSRDTLVLKTRRVTRPQAPPRHCFGCETARSSGKVSAHYKSPQDLSLSPPAAGLQHGNLWRF